MNVFAEIKQGRVVALYNDERSLEAWRNIFSPNTFWLDVTGKEVKVGYVIAFDPICEWVLKPPIETDNIDDVGTLDVMKDNIESLKAENQDLKAQLSDINDALEPSIVGSMQVQIDDMQSWLTEINDAIMEIMFDAGSDEMLD